LQIVEVDAAHLVGVARDCHHARVRASLQLADQARGEREVAEVVGAELQLEAIPCLPPRRRHHARVVDQQIQALVVAPGAKARGEGRHRRQVGEVQCGRLEARTRRPLLDRALRLRGLGAVAACEHDARAVARKLPRGSQPEAAVGPGDDRGAPPLIGDLLARPPAAHAVSSPCPISTGIFLLIGADSRWRARRAAQRASACADRGSARHPPASGEPRDDHGRVRGARTAA